jgi:S-adenosylmethionine hydrolase
MAILTLTSDWGSRDHYLASFKGMLLSRIPSIHLIDVSHDIENYNTIQAAFIVQNTFDKFPDGSIHFIAVSNSENCTSKNPYLVVRYKGHFLIGEDNGMFNLIIGSAEKEVIRLPFDSNLNKKELNESFAVTIRKITEGEYDSLGTREETVVQSFLPPPFVDSNSIKGTIIFIDSFGNAILNVTKQLFEKERKERTISILFRRSKYDVSEISSTYTDVDIGEMVAFFNQNDFLEIALNRESAAKLLGLRLMDPVRIEFDDHTTG